MDLTPRASEPSKKPRRWLPIVLLSLVGLGGIVIVTQFLTSAIDYYCNVDEIGVRSGCEESTRLRVQGTVEQGSLQRTDGKTSFVMTFNSKSIDVVYAGDPGGGAVGRLCASAQPCACAHRDREREMEREREIDIDI